MPIIQMTVKVKVDVDPGKACLRDFTKEALKFFGGGLHPSSIMFSNINSVTVTGIHKYEAKPRPYPVINK